MQLIFDSLNVAEEQLAKKKVLWSFETCVLVTNNLCEKIIVAIRITSNICWKFKSCFIPITYSWFNLLTCELDHFKALYWVIL